MELPQEAGQYRILYVTEEDLLPIDLGPLQVGEGALPDDADAVEISE